MYVKSIFIVLDKPTSVVINDVTDSSINVSWIAPSLGGGATTVTGYLVTIFPDEGDAPDIQGTIAVITGLTSNKEYTISVVAMAADGRNGTALETTVPTGMFIVELSHTVILMGTLV